MLPIAAKSVGLIHELTLPIFLDINSDECDSSGDREDKIGVGCLLTTLLCGEYTSKLEEYTQMGVLYYVIYNPKRKRKPKLEIYKLQNGKYELQAANPLWMPEIGLGIGNERAEYGGLTRDWLYWYDENNRRYPTPAERIDRLAAKLRALGIDPDE